MRKNIFKILFMALPMVLGLASCSQSDNAVDTPTEIAEAPNVSGTWYATVESKGTVNGVDYDRVSQALVLNADGNGYGVTFYFKDGEETPVEVTGGEYFAPLTYTVGADKYIKLNFSGAYYEYTDYYSKWTLFYGGGAINCSAGDLAFQLLPATDEEKENVKMWDHQANGGDDTKSYNIEQESVTFGATESHWFTLSNIIDTYGPSGTSDWLTKTGNIDLVLRVTPAYLQSSNGSNAGDYYFVTCAVTPHNGSLWGPYKEDHFWAQIRIYGYWFKDLDLSVELVNEDGSSINGLSYYERPIPENKNNSKSYTNGKTISLSGTLSGGYQQNKKNKDKQGFHGEGSITCGATWSSSSNYTLDDIEFTLDSSSPTVKYHYSSSNVKLKDDWDKTYENFPTACHSEFTGRSLWVWKVGSVKDGDTKKFKIKASVNANYSSWYHWRAASEFDKNRKDYSTSFSREYTLGIPDRTPWGYIDLKNAMSSEMANVRFISTSNNQVVKQLTSSYSKDQVASAALSEGTYNVVFDQLDPNTNKVLSTWTIKNVKVHQGKDKASATLSLSTTSAVKN